MQGVDPCLKYGQQGLAKRANGQQTSKSDSALFDGHRLHHFAVYIMAHRPTDIEKLFAGTSCHYNRYLFRWLLHQWKNHEKSLSSIWQKVVEQEEPALKHWTVSAWLDIWVVILSGRFPKVGLLDLLWEFLLGHLPQTSVLRLRWNVLYCKLIPNATTGDNSTRLYCSFSNTAPYFVENSANHVRGGFWTILNTALHPDEVFSSLSSSSSWTISEVLFSATTSALESTLHVQTADRSHDCKQIENLYLEQ